MDAKQMQQKLFLLTGTKLHLDWNTGNLDLYKVDFRLNMTVHTLNSILHLKSNTKGWAFKTWTLVT